jgi:aminoglycoside phosphotransferase (APT) family kinase protein
MQDDPVLRRFSLSQDDLLGFGGESRVYALDDERVLRVYQRGVDRGYVDQLREFYDKLGSRDLPFEIPVVIEIATHGGLLYSIEKRIQGSRMSDFLKTATGEARTRSLVSYVETANRVQELPFEGNEFGELLLPASMRQPAWTEYLLARARDSISRADADLARDVPDLNDVVAGWERELSLVSEVRTARLVHGDYFPGNVMVNDRGQVVAVIDFSPMSLAGDPRLDVLCALIFIEVDDGYQSSDSETVRQLIAERHGEAILRLESVYRTYYSLYFSPVRRSDPKLYAWCIANLAS